MEAPRITLKQKRRQVMTYLSDWVSRNFILAHGIVASLVGGAATWGVLLLIELFFSVF